MKQRGKDSVFEKKGTEGLENNPSVPFSRKGHWEKVYSSRAPTEVSWFQEHAALSLKLIREAGVAQTDSIIDIGGGASTLVDDLLAEGYGNITVLDVSAAALAAAKARLGARAADVRWLEADVLDAPPPEDAYDVWHDRAVFHFLTAPADRRAYVEAVLRAVRPGGLVIVATFAEDGPTMCSGLPVMRYSAAGLHAEFGEAFALVAYEKESHKTPGGALQRFGYCVLRTAAP